MDRKEFSHRDDILLWGDGFWCYRKNYLPGLAEKLGADYRIVPNQDKEWWALVRRIQPPKNRF